MDYRLESSRRLHDEHMAAEGLLARLETTLARIGRAPAPPPEDQELRALLGSLTAAIEGEIVPHFRFEEESIFPALITVGDDAMAALLRGEHDVILPLASRLAELARRADFDADSWAEFHRLGFEFRVRLRDHIDKEEMGLLPLMENLLEPEEV